MDKYTVLTELGVGVSSTVHLGLDNDTKEKVAIKVMYPKYTQNALKEIDMLSYLSEAGGGNKNSVRYIDSIQVDGSIWIITEFLSGGDMYYYLDDFDELTFSNKIKVLINMAQCIADVHRKGVAHRDIKPENFIIDRGSLNVKLIDFGSSCIVKPRKHLQEKYKNLAVCSEPAVFGTIDLLSPEAISNYHGAGKRSFVINNYFANDIYSLGGTFFYLFDPYCRYVSPVYHSGNNESEVREMLRIIQEPSLENIIFDMVRYNPEDRPSIDEVLDRLQQLHSA